MLEKIIISIIVGCCIFFISRRFYRQFKSVIDGRGAPCCTDCCSSCKTSPDCDDKEKLT